MNVQGRSSPNVPKRIEIIHYLRGLASLAVAWFHLTRWADGVWLSGTYGWLGVEVFFVISGFVIPYSISTTYQTYSASAFASFISRRLVRIEVPYIVSILVVVLLHHLSAVAPGFDGAAPNYTSAQIVSNIFYVATWTGQKWLQPIYWTLAYEFAFYLTIGLLFSVLFGKGRSLAYLLTVGILVLAAIGGAISSIVLLFVMGSAVFRYVIGSEHYLIAMGTVIACVVAIGLAGNSLIAVAGLTTATSIGFGKGIHVNGSLGRVLTYLGTISYSLYLIHVPIGGRVVNLASRFVHGQSEHLIVSGLALAIALASAHMFYNYVERPTLRKARQLVYLRMGRNACGQPNLMIES
jgi:peptidoglycan/LPS O-acetylase OafA/YrhL